MDNSTSKKLIEALSHAASNEIVCDAETVRDLVDLDEDETAEWVASTYANTEMINVFRCDASGAASAFVASYHSDGGVISGGGGPYSSFDDVVREIATDEGWTMV
jgi:uncharacterized protein YcaQ